MSTVRVLVWSHLVGLVVTIGWVAATGGDPTWGDLVIGAVGGGFGLGGLYFLYSGLARGRAAVVAPAAAVVGAGVPVIAGVALGERPGTLAWAGVLLAFPAIVAVSSVEGVSRRVGGLRHGVVAGAFFGGYFVVFSLVSEASGLWPLLGSRAASVAVLWVIALTAQRDLAVVPRGGVAWVVLGVGVFDLVANAAYLGAIRTGRLVVVAVVASLFPAVTVLASRIVYQERLSSRQIAGLVAGVGAVALLSVP